MASRKKQPEAELLPPEEDDGVRIETKPVKKVVESRVVTYEAPPEETLIEEGEEFEFEEEPRKRKKKTDKEEADKLRQDMAKNGVTPVSDLRVYITKFVNPQTSEGGMFAEMEDFGKHQISRDALLRGDHMDIARAFGPGRYYFKVYKGQILVTHFDGRIGAMPNGFGQNQNGQQVVTMPDPQNPNVTIQMPAGQTQPPIDMRKAMREYMKDMKDTAEMFGFVPAGQIQQQSPQPQMSAKATLLEALASEGDLVGDTIRALKRKSGGDSGEKDLTVMLIEHGPDLIRAAGDVIKGIIFDLKGGNNGQAPMGTQAHANTGQALEAGRNEHGQVGQVQNVQASDNGQVYQENPLQLQPVSPEDELFARVLNFCKRKTPPAIAATEIVNFASIVEENPAAMVPGYGLVRQFPIGASLWPYVDLFTNTPAEQVLSFVASGENGKEVAEMEHAQSWCEQLQAELKKLEGEVKENE